jgi:hypothetical protein
MSVHAGSIIHVGGNNVIDRIQRAGLGDVNTPMEVIREVGNDRVVDKIPGDPDFTFTLESFDVSSEIEAFLNGAWASGMDGDDGVEVTIPDGTGYSWSKSRAVNVVSPWKNPLTGLDGIVEAGHIIPGYYANRIRYQFGVTDNSTIAVDLSGGSYYYNGNAPVEDRFAAPGTAFTSTEPAVAYRKGGAEGTSFKRAFGVILDGVLLIEGVDYTQDHPDDGTTQPVTVTLTTPKVSGPELRFAYFTTTEQAFPQSVHPSTVIKPAAVRGRHICVFLGQGADRQKVGSVQSFSLEATVDAQVEREFCNDEIVGLTINGRDCNGDMVVRSKNAQAFLNLAAKVVGVDVDEVLGYLNMHHIPLEVCILNPKNPAQVLKTLYVDDAIFQIPGTAAQVNQPTDFTFRWESAYGDYTAYKGGKP